MFSIWNSINSLHRLFLLLYMNHITGAVSFLSDAGIVVLFKENGAVVLPETVGQKHSDHQITSRFRPSLCARKTGRNMMGLSHKEIPVVL